MKKQQQQQKKTKTKQIIKKRYIQTLLYSIYSQESNKYNGFIIIHKIHNLITQQSHLVTQHLTTPHPSIVTHYLQVGTRKALLIKKT